MHNHDKVTENLLGIGSSFFLGVVISRPDELIADRATKREAIGTPPDNLNHY
ncbi:MAG: hypothetical protein ACTHYC_03750 [Sphingobacterium sp.]